MSDTIYPLTFSPVFRNYIWGGRNLETKLGRTLPPGVIAESWEISGHPSSPTQVDHGPLAGKTLPELVTLLGEALVGHRSRAMLARGKFPLLVKLLDANQPLSVQVHPDDEYANRHENGELGKTEMWYILHAEPNAHLIYGLKPGLTPASFRQHLEASDLESCLHRLPVKAGDAIFVPAGSVHALLAGILVAEIQQNSDTTYRVYDWNRVGADGKPRPLHVDKALEVIDFDLVEPSTYSPELVEENKSFRREVITASAHFNVERVTFTGENISFAGQCDGSTFEIWGAVSGQAQIIGDEDILALPAVRFALLPARLGEFKVKAIEPSVLLRAYVPA
jgi:mannose-6-phosphate isomerase